MADRKHGLNQMADEDLQPRDDQAAQLHGGTEFGIGAGAAGKAKIAPGAVAAAAGVAGPVKAMPGPAGKPGKIPSKNTGGLKK